MKVKLNEHVPMKVDKSDLGPQKLLYLQIYLINTGTGTSLCRFQQVPITSRPIHSIAVEAAKSNAAGSRLSPIDFLVCPHNQNRPQIANKYVSWAWIEARVGLLPCFMQKACIEFSAGQRKSCQYTDNIQVHVYANNIHIGYILEFIARMRSCTASSAFKFSLVRPLQVQLTSPVSSLYRAYTQALQAYCAQVHVTQSTYRPKGVHTAHLTQCRVVGLYGL